MDVCSLPSALSLLFSLGLLGFGGLGVGGFPPLPSLFPRGAFPSRVRSLRGCVLAEPLACGAAPAAQAPYSACAVHTQSKVASSRCALLVAWSSRGRLK
jgi:hypothetical protein